MNAPNTQQFANKKPLGLSSNISNHGEHHVADNPTMPEVITPKAWREPLQVPAYAQEPREFRWPSPYAFIGYAFIIFFFIYGVVEMGFVMWHAFLQAIR